MKSMSSQLLFALGAFIMTLVLSKATLAQTSYEVMCRSKAKELAAETYKGCMTENRQAEVEQIRKDYKSKLAKLKNHYDEKLKKLSGGSQTETRSEEKVGTSVELKPTVSQSKRGKQRASGARLPMKKQDYSTQVIDLSQPIDAQINPSEEVLESARLEKKDPSENNEIEIVELPAQE